MSYRQPWSNVKLHPIEGHFKKPVRATFEHQLFIHLLEGNWVVLYCIVSIHLYSASCSVHQSEALPVRQIRENEKRHLAHQLIKWIISREGVGSKGLNNAFSHNIVSGVVLLQLN